MTPATSARELREQVVVGLTLRLAWGALQDVAAERMARREDTSRWRLVVRLRLRREALLALALARALRREAEWVESHPPADMGRRALVTE